MAYGIKHACPAHEMDKLVAAIHADFMSLRARAWVWVLWGSVPTLGIAMFVAHSTAHYAHSGLSPTGYIDPRYMIDGIGAIPLWLACAGVVFLALDLNRIDGQDQVAQSVFARPVANVQLVLGRLCALAGAAWLSLLVLAIALWAIGIASQVLDWPMGAPVESTSMVGFLVVESIPAITIFTGFVLLLNATGNSVLSIVPLVVLGIQMLVLFYAPSHLWTVTSIIGDFDGIASDFLPEVANRDELIRGGCSTVIGTGLCVIAAALHPRLDSVQPRWTLATGFAFVATGAIGAASLANAHLHAIEERDDWAEAHASIAHHQTADIERISAQVSIEPEERLTLEANLQLVLPPGSASTRLILSSNPGIKIQEVRLDNRIASFRHELGILTVMLDEKVTARNATLFVRSTGVPDPRFAYLDSAVDQQKKSLASSELHLLGTEASIFSKHYVALMPGIGWLPFPGANYRQDNAEPRVRDYFELDLEVTVPAGWIVVGPGPRTGNRPGRLNTHISFPPPCGVDQFRHPRIANA